MLQLPLSIGSAEAGAPLGGISPRQLGDVGGGGALTVLPAPGDTLQNISCLLLKDVLDILGESDKLRNHQVPLEGLEDEYNAGLDNSEICSR